MFFRPAQLPPCVRLLCRVGLALLALAASAGASAEELRLRALLMAPPGSGTPLIDPGLRGEARVIVHPDGQARLDLVSWELPAGPAEAVLRISAADEEDAALPLLVVPVQRDADEGRVIGAGFRLDATAARRLRAGEGRILLTPERQPDAIVLGALRPHPQAPRLPAGRLQAAD